MRPKLPGCIDAKSQLPCRVAPLTRALSSLVRASRTHRLGARGNFATLFMVVVLIGSCVGAEPSRPATQGNAGLLTTAKAPGASAATATTTSMTSRQADVSPSSAPTLELAANARAIQDHSQPAPVTSSLGQSAPGAEFEAFRVALSDKDFSAARRWLTENSVQLDPNVDALAHSVVSLGLNQPEQALERLRTLDPKLAVPVAWLGELTARGHAHSDAYLSYLPTLRRNDNFSNTLSVASRLLQDERLVECETFVNRALSLANGFHARGQARFLRAKLRLAQQRPTQAEPDLRWLALSNPQHADSEQAFALLSQPPFTRLSSSDLYLRANQLADHGLVEATDIAAAGLQATRKDKAGLADLEYLRGLARYRKRLFTQSLAPLDSAVRMGSHKSDHARYLAARATARAGDAQAAIARFKHIARSTPVTKTVSNAAFFIAREHSMAGNWEDAARAYGEFQARFPNHEYAKLVEQDLLPVWFAAGHYKRVVYWARQLREKAPERADSSLLRSIEALALLRLGHTDLATQIWLGLAQTSPLSFAGVVARLHLTQLGTQLEPLFIDGMDQHERLNVRIPEAVTQLDALGFSRQAEYALQRHEATLVREFAPRTDAALCDAYAPLRSGRRRYELGYDAAKRRGLRDAPQLVDPWLWHCYYPTPFADAVTRHTRQYPVSPALVYAVMRQESAFIEAVESSAGAHGLMQIIDPTARRIAAELNRPYELDDLNRPDYNIEFGVFYLNKLQRYFAHPALIAAAYNAGPEATARWFAAGKTLPLEVFVLRIPYEETRTYVQRVIANLAVYQTLAPEFPKLDVALDFSTASVDLAQSLPEALHGSPEDFY